MSRKAAEQYSLFSSVVVLGVLQSDEYGNQIEFLNFALRT